MQQVPIVEQDQSADYKISTPGLSVRDDSETYLPSVDEKVVQQPNAGHGKIPKNPFTTKSSYPALDWSSPAGFASTLKVRLRLIFTRRFLLCLAWGQVLSICISATNVCSTELFNRNWALPTTQSFFVYFTLLCIYTPYTIYAYGFKAWGKMIFKDGWKYFILAAVDVEANFSVVKAYQYTDILSAALLNSFATPVCMVVAFFLMRIRYHWSQILGVLIALVGFALLVVSDFIAHGGTQAANKPKGDGLAVLAATLYGVSNALEEFLVRGRPLYEVVGQLGMWGTIINGVQAAALEHNGIAHEADWNGSTVGILIAYVCAMLVIYTTAPLLFRATSSPFYNLSLLTSSFFALLWGFALYHLSTYWLYGLAFPLVIIGMVIYFSCSSPDHQADESFAVTPRGKRAEHV